MGLNGIHPKCPCPEASFMLPQEDLVNRDYQKLPWILGGASFVLFTMVLDYLAYKLRLSHRSWAPGVAIGLAATVVALARYWLQGSRR